MFHDLTSRLQVRRVGYVPLGRYPGFSVYSECPVIRISRLPTAKNTQYPKSTCAVCPKYSLFSVPSVSTLPNPTSYPALPRAPSMDLHLDTSMYPLLRHTLLFFLVTWTLLRQVCTQLPTSTAFNARLKWDGCTKKLFKKLKNVRVGVTCIESLPRVRHVFLHCLTLTSVESVPC